MVQYGPRGLEDWELMALLLGTPRPDLARELVREDLRELSLESLQERPGVGLARASTVLAAVELGRRLHRQTGPPVTSPQEAYLLVADLAELRKEHFRCLYLDARRRLLASETISIGTLTASLVHPREVFQPAVARSAASLLVAHNHPSGDPEPSAEDLALTRRLRQAGDILGIELVDHLVVGRGSYVSLKELGYL
ncbi:DNA repair protein RadC [bacterium CPR1]|nr:DNA repair protein RadC [bacterium CPR1]